MATLSASPVIHFRSSLLTDPRRATVPEVSTSVDAPQLSAAIEVPARALRLLLAFVAVLLVSIGMSALAGAESGAAVTSSPTSIAAIAEGTALPAYTIVPGDTLWSIAEAVNPDADPRATILQLRVLNDLGPGRVLQPGQVLLVPHHLR